MLNTSVTHVIELENAIINIRLLLIKMLTTKNAVDKAYIGEIRHRKQVLTEAAESFGLDLNNEDLRDLSDEDDPFGTGDI